MKRVIFFISSMFSAFLCSAQSQELPKVIPPSPTAIQFQRFGDYPVSHFTGVPQISIPIYTIKEGEIELPISISYHASGSRPNEPRGLLGQGWVLNIGGQISREIRDKPDEYFTFNIPSLTAANIPYWDGGYRQSDLYFRSKNYDLEHDVYSYDCNGQSGKFILKANGEPLLFPYKNLRVNAGGQGTMNTIFGMEIIDENGLSYSYGDNNGQSIEFGEYTDTRSNDIVRTPATTWHLTRIKSNLNPYNNILIEYQPDQSINEWIDSKQWIFDDAWETTGCLNTCNTESQCTSGWEALKYSPRIWGSLPLEAKHLIHYQTVSPKKIIFSTGYILFSYDENTKVLLKASVYNKNNELINIISFSVLPFASTSPQNLYSRFKLSSIEFKDAQENKVNKYLFNYDSEQDDDRVASEYTDSYDYWGFNNSTTAVNTGGFPLYTNLLTRTEGAPYERTIGHIVKFSNASVASNENHTKSYTLNKITYPTGGYTLFIYELNQTADKYNNYFISEYGGGLRVKSIQNYIDNKKVSEKKYIYNRGIMPIKPHPHFYLTSQYGLMTRLSTAVPMWFRRNYYSMSPKINFSPFGSSVIYPEVLELTVADKPSDNISTTYKYDFDGTAMEQKPLDFPNNTEYGVTLPPHFKYYSSNLKPWKYGNLISKSITSSDGKSIEETYEYEEIIKGTERDFILEPYAFPETPWSGCFWDNGMSNTEIFFNNFYGTYAYDCYYNFADRYYISGYNRLKNKSSNFSSIASNSTLYNSLDYFYENPSYDLLTHTISTNSKGEEIKTVFKRPFDFASTNLSSVNVYNDMLDKHIVSPIIERNVFNNNNLIESIRTNYNSWFNNAWGVYDPSGHTNILFPQTVEVKKGNTSWETRLHYDALDETGNIKTVFKPGGVKHTYLWGYGRKYPVAEITGVDYLTAASYISQAVLDNPTTTDAQLRTELNKIRLGLGSAKTLVNTFTYKPLVGMTSQTDASGKTTYFEYDAATRLQHIKDLNGNILKKYTYNYFDGATESVTAAQWQNTSNGFCETCKSNNNYVTGVYKQEQIDNNIQSPSYNQKRWVDIYSNSCVSASPDWVPTGNLRCVMISSQNTGEQEREELYVNPCKNPAGLSVNWGNSGQIKRWVNIGQNLSACPKPALYNSDDLTGHYRKSNCGQDYLGTEVFVSVPAGMFTSPISVEAANNLAQLYAYQQANLDVNASCTPISFPIVFNNESSVAFDIEFYDAGTTNLKYTLFGSSSPGVNAQIGTILPGNYDIRFSPRFTPSQSSITHYVGCGLSISGIDVTIYNVLMGSGCNSITIQ